jgi:alpha-beta hydrolase superfamily lysophospholipase
MHQVQPVAVNDRPGEHLYLTAGDGVLLQGRRWLPEQTEARAAAIFMHGIASHGAWFAETAAFLAEHEIAVYALDRRGSGLSGGPRGHISSYGQAIADAEACLDLVAREHPGRPVFLIGSSWAAKLAVAVAARQQDRLAGLILHGPVLFPRVDLSVPQKLLVLTTHRSDSQRQVPIPLSPALYTKNPDGLAYIEGDPYRLLTASVRFFWETRRLDRARERFAERLKLPVLLVMGTEDAIADATATAVWITTLPTRNWIRRFYIGASHTLDFEPEPMVCQYREDLLGWLDGQIASGGR